MFLFLFLYTVYGLVKKKKEMANKDFENTMLMLVLLISVSKFLDPRFSNSQWLWLWSTDTMFHSEQSYSGVWMKSVLFIIHRCLNPDIDLANICEECHLVLGVPSDVFWCMNE